MITIKFYLEIIIELKMCPTVKQESDGSCICPIYLSVTSCATAAKGCCRARAQIT